MFPNVEVVSVDTRGSMMRDKEGEYMMPIEEGIESITPSLLQKRFAGKSELIYTLNIKGLTQRGSVTRGKMYVRAKNFFEPSMIETLHVKRSNQISVGNVYTVTLGVRK